ncbi:MAG TPA: amidohydrolase family protein [Streptosporangiaceae bacterium]|nr:amidohydrolase family protein [Streptosporangiaceae bacterium]
MVPGIIDLHVHVGDFARMREDIRGLIQATSETRDFDLPSLFSDPEQLVPYFKSAGAVRVVLIADEGPGVNFVPTTDFVCDFRDAAGESRDFFLVFGNINPNRASNILEKYESDKRRGIRGYKLYPADHDFEPVTPELMAFYHRLEEDGLVLMFHTGTTGQSDGVDAYGDPRLFKPILDECPALPLIMAHAGKPTWCGEAADFASEYENCYLDTAFIRPEKLLTYIPRLVELQDKVLFGSDWPVGVASLSDHLSGIRALGLPGEVTDKMFYHNAARVLGIA